MAAELRETSSPVAVDIYDPYHLENLEMGGDDRAEAGPGRDPTGRGRQRRSASRGLFHLRQRAPTGFLAGFPGRVGPGQPVHLRGDPLLGQLVSVVPFGLPERAARAGKARACETLSRGSGRDDKVVLWGGGVYNWLDPISLLRAVEPLEPAASGAAPCLPRDAPPQPRRPR